MEMTAIQKIVQNSNSFTYFHYCFIHSPRPYVGHWKTFLHRFYFEYVFQPFYQYRRQKNTNIIKYVSSLEFCYFCCVLLRSKLIREKCPHYVPRRLEVEKLKNLGPIFFYNYIFKIRASLSLTLICSKIQMCWYICLQ